VSVRILSTSRGLVESEAERVAREEEREEKDGEEEEEEGGEEEDEEDAKVGAAKLLKR